MLARRVLDTYLVLCKPKVVLLMLLTAWVGMILAEPGSLSWPRMMIALVGIGFVASSGAAVNHLIDRHIDALMDRTRNRPLPKGELTSRAVLTFATLLGLIGFCLLYIFINLLTALLTLAALVGYAVVYTGFLKRRTPQNIVIGGLAGALPPLLGWTAVTNEVSANSLLLVMIIYLWTPPHFWALAIHRYDDYCRVKIPMLPVTHGIAYTKLNILLYSILLSAFSLLPFVVGMSHLIYLAGVVILNVIFLHWAIALMRADAESTPAVSMGFFKYSITYLMVLFVVMCVDHFVVVERFWGRLF